MKYSVVDKDTSETYGVEKIKLLGEITEVTLEGGEVVKFKTHFSNEFFSIRTVDK